MTGTAVRVTFEPLRPQHLQLLTRWLQAPHVRAFWDDGERDEGAVQSHYFEDRDRVPGFIFSEGGSPAGFLQCEHLTPEHGFWPYATPDGETWAVDLLIGEEELMGRGLGPRVICAFLARLAARPPGWQRILIDPDVRNVRAIRAYTKAEFVPVALLGSLQLMALDRAPSFPTAV
ncbi:acetyltransferase [Deinococcus malanensis]|uniref:Acetyltransferase n=1 Tax=Deinococcus malanensis TaxID=1706855 RepID=A0ABQ2EUC8_9DEIO|nr:GNAT family N-acetyltransferase [Deinococcus malanensis]GGK26874.1 acetyltransferase [Deinococcus malanensis]